MATEAVDIVNMALGKIGGAGDQVDGSAFVSSLSDTDSVSSFCNTAYPQVRKKVIIDLALRDAPFRETAKYADLGADIKALDKDISTIEVGASPTYTITVTTDEDHDLSTGDTVALLKIDGDGGITGLNGTTYTITVTDTDVFTLDDTTGDSDYDHTADSGVVSLSPDVGGWLYVFDLPSECIAVVKQLDETFTNYLKHRTKYRFETALNKDSDGLVLMTNNYTNASGDGAFVQYVIDQDDPTIFCNELIECIATRLAAELCPVVGRSLKTRQEMMMEYLQVKIPEAMAYNLGQFDNRSKPETDYLGGRGEVSQSIPKSTIRRATNNF